MTRTAMDKVRDYAFYMGRPFTYRQAAADLGICESSAVKSIRKLRAAGIIKPIGKQSEGIYKAVKLTEHQALEQELKGKTVKEIAVEQGVSKEAVYQKLRPFMLPKELRATRNQYEALKLIADGWQPNGYRETTKSLLKRGWVVEVSVFTYEITDKGREVLNAQSRV